MTYLDAFIIGTVQGFAVLPGLSRSASTIGFGLLLGFVGRWAADYTFLLAIPAIVGAAGVEIISALRHQGPGFFATPDFARYLVGAAVAGIVGYMTIGFLIRMVSTRKVHWFALYCFVFGLVLIFFFPKH
jgi:undecaprenyl-diphosphatase